MSAPPRPLWPALGLSLLSLSLLGGCSSLSELLPKNAAAKSAETAGQPRLVAEYKLEVQAPSGLKNLLQEHLDLARFRNTPEDQRLSTQELGRLTAAAPEQARALLETEGYFNAQVEASRDFGQTPITVTVKVDPGPRTVVKKLSLGFVGELQTPTSLSAESAPRAEARAQRIRESLQEAWSMKEGEDFVQSRWSSAKSGLLGRARAQGYPTAKLEKSTAAIDAENNAAELEVVLDSGPLYRLGELRIEGLKNQPRAAIERLAGYRVGQPYTERALLDFQERLVKTTLFDSVNVNIRPELEPAPPSATSATSATSPAEASASAPTAGGVTTPVWVDVREAPRQQLTASLGLSTTNGPRLGLDYTNRRPWGLDLRSRLKLKASQDNPSLDWELTSHPQTDMQRNLGALFIERLPDGDRVSVNLRARLGRLRETDKEDRIYYLEVLRARESDPEQVISSGAVSGNVQWTWRRVDSTLVPTKGYTASLLLGLGRADNSISSSGAFGHGELQLHGYQPLPGGWFGNARTSFSQIYAREDVGLPEALRFRAGGDDSVRGYGLRDLGPVDADGNPTGGKVMWTGSLELAHALMPSLPDLLGAGFVDAGQAAMSWRGFKPELAYGLGLRYRSPLGTLRLDFARAQSLQKWRIHFSVGIAL
ncbi:outer membrane protein assembly factor [Paucibacter sp. KBW04]|uniref:autotransporter assembly complex protein TamA n=1 Tax=Paucibacter sp. KBW04 TaxID=2153361 RepID=UPI000F55B796|nr:BamA/TamA family outer membrane protein [Paucibacter sp. KBW04]RQO63040.1 outer membrane protein assembly factor [Paucibacter sp. KBW04]